MSVLEVFRLVWGLLICAVAGAPLSTISVLLPYMRDAGIYTEQCVPDEITSVARVSQEVLNFSPFERCKSANAAYSRLFIASLAACGFAAFPAYFLVRRHGFTVPALCTTLFLAAGAVLISDSNNEIIFDQYFDRFLLGFPLIAASAPFAITSAAASVFRIASGRLRVAQILLAMVFVCTRLQPFFFSLLVQSFPEFDDMMLYFLRVPVIMFFCVLVLMTFAGNNSRVDDEFDFPPSILPDFVDTSIFRYLGLWAALNGALIDAQLLFVKPSSHSNSWEFMVPYFGFKYKVGWEFVALNMCCFVFASLGLSVPVSALLFSAFSLFTVHIKTLYPLYATIHALLVVLLFVRFINPNNLLASGAIVCLLTAAVNLAFLLFGNGNSLLYLQRAQLLVALGMLYFPKKESHYQHRVQLEIEAESV